MHTVPAVCILKRLLPLDITSGAVSLPFESGQSELRLCSQTVTQRARQQVGQFHLVCHKGLTGLSLLPQCYRDRQALTTGPAIEDTLSPAHGYPVLVLVHLKGEREGDLVDDGVWLHV